MVFIKYHGFVMHRTPIIPLIVRNICMQSSITAGRISSTCPKSMANRLRILPDGFAWKKYRAVRETPWNMVLCNWVDECIAMLKKSRVRSRAKITRAALIPLKM